MARLPGLLDRMVAIGAQAFNGHNVLVLLRAAQAVAQVDASCLSEDGHAGGRLRVERVEILPDSDEQTLVPPARVGPERQPAVAHLADHPAALVRVEPPPSAK